MSRLVTSAFLLLFNTSMYAQGGNLNYNFNGGAFTTVFGNAGSQVEDLAVQADGKLIAAGLAFIDGVARFALVRYNLNGSLDTSFGGTGKITTLIGSESWAYAVVIQQDGKIIAGGYAKTNTIDFALARYNKDGSPDNSFGIAGIVTTDVGINTDGLLDDDKIKDLALHSDGKIVAVGETFNGTNFDIGLVQYQSNGTLLNRAILSAGSLNDFGNRVAIRPNGRILVTGCTYTNLNTADVVLAQYLSNGLTPDPSFGNSGVVITAIGQGDDFGKGIALQTDGKVVLTGATWQTPGSYDIFVIRYALDGAPDTGFGDEGKIITDISGSFDDAIGISVQTDGKLIVGGSAVSGQHDDFFVARFTSSGIPDLTFGTSGIISTPVGSYSDIAYGMAVSGNRIYLGGIANRTSAGTPGDFALASFQNNDVPLPLKLISFSAEKQANVVLLKWETEWEVNIRSFIVERSADGRNFKPLQEISALNTASVKKYSVTDSYPFAAMNYYRLKIFETGGTFTYSRVLAVKNNSLSLELFPNPARSSSNLQLPPDVQGKIKINIYESTGKMVRTFQLEASGNSTVTVLDLAGITPGIYLIQVSSGNQFWTSRLVRE